MTLSALRLHHGRQSWRPTTFTIPSWDPAYDRDSQSSAFNELLEDCLLTSPSSGVMSEENVLPVITKLSSFTGPVHIGYLWKMPQYIDDLNRKAKYASDLVSASFACEALGKNLFEQFWIMSLSNIWMAPGHTKEMFRATWCEEIWWLRHKLYTSNEVNFSRWFFIELGEIDSWKGMRP